MDVALARNVTIEGGRTYLELAIVGKGGLLTVLFRQLGHVTFLPKKKNYSTSVNHISSMHEQNLSERTPLDSENFTEDVYHFPSH